MDARQLIVERCEQMRQMLASAKEIDCLDIAGNLRQLLADQHRLIDTANVNKVPIRFRSNKLREDPPGLPIPSFRSIEDGLDPDTAAPIHGAPYDMTIDQFLGQTILVIGGKPYSVKDVIKFAANVAGAIHHDPKAKPEFEAQKRYSELFRIGGFPAGIRQLRAIARITLKALQPLLADIAARP
jgi:hypothetical protein